MCARPSNRVFTCTESCSSLVSFVFLFSLQLDAILQSSSGQISRSDARLLRFKSGLDRKSQLSNEDDVSLCLSALIAHGWIRDNPNEVHSVSAGRRSRAAGSEANLCLAERSYAELRAYIEEQIKGKKCASCQQPVLLVRTHTDTDRPRSDTPERALSCLSAFRLTHCSFLCVLSFPGCDLFESIHRF